MEVFGRQKKLVEVNGSWWKSMEVGGSPGSIWKLAEVDGGRWKSPGIQKTVENYGRLWELQVGGLLWKIVYVCETCGSRWNSIGLYGSS